MLATISKRVEYIEDKRTIILQPLAKFNRLLLICEGLELAHEYAAAVINRGFHLEKRLKAITVRNLLLLFPMLCLIASAEEVHLGFLLPRDALNWVEAGLLVVT